jgi:hypothetical protein
MDPKDDEWAPHLYRKACEDAGKPFALIDLRKQQYQLNLIEDITPDELEELFVAGFSLAKGRNRIFIALMTEKPRVSPHNLSVIIHRQQSVMFITVITFRDCRKNQSIFRQD